MTGKSRINIKQDKETLNVEMKKRKRKPKVILV